MEVQVDRTLPIPIGQQVIGQIAHAISCGILQPGERLPSLRELSASLGIAYMTISHIYRELSEAGLVIIQPAKGAFVADITRIDEVGSPLVTQGNLLQMADTFVRQATLFGHPPERIVEAVTKQVGDQRSTRQVRYMIFVGNAPQATRSYARTIENALQDLGLSVQPVLLSELQAAPDDLLARLQPARLVVTVPTELQKVRDLLSPRGYQVVSIAFQISPDTRRRLSSISASARVGVLATQVGFVQSLMQGVSSYLLSDVPLRFAVQSDEEQVKQALNSVDIVVYHSGCEEALRLLPPSIETIEYLHWPEPDSVARLRPLLESFSALGQQAPLVQESTERAGRRLEIVALEQ